MAAACVGAVVPEAVVPGAGLEPARAEAQWILNPSRLPVSPPRLRFQECTEAGRTIEISALIRGGIHGGHFAPPGN
jgi:hypothetical protein